MGKSTKVAASNPKVLPLDEWVTVAVKRQTRCRVCCAQGCAEACRRILTAIVTHKAFGISARKILERLRQEFPSADLTLDGLQCHLSNHESALWGKSRGR